MIERAKIVNFGTPRGHLPIGPCVAFIQEVSVLRLSRPEEFYFRDFYNACGQTTFFRKGIGSWPVCGELSRRQTIHLMNIVIPVSRQVSTVWDSYSVADEGSLPDHIRLMPRSHTVRRFAFPWSSTCRLLSLYLSETAHEGKGFSTGEGWSRKRISGSRVWREWRRSSSFTLST